MFSFSKMNYEVKYIKTRMTTFIKVSAHEIFQTIISEQKMIYCVIKKL